MSSILEGPFTCIIAGPTGCGKTQLVMKLLRYYKQMITPTPNRILWFYAIHQQQNFNTMKKLGVEFHEGVPYIDLIQTNPSTHTVVVIDDLMAETNSEIMNIFTKGSHHKNISCFYLTQNLYYGGKHNRTMNLNTHYMFLFKNPRDSTQIQVLSRQMFPHNSRYLEEAFFDATSSDAHSYLFIDLKNATDDKLRLRTRIFPDDYPYHYVYVPKTAI